MNYDDFKKNGENRLEVTDSLNAPLLNLSIKPKIKGSKNTLVIAVEDKNLNKKKVNYNLKSPLQILNDKQDEFLIEPTFKGNKVSMTAKVIRKLKEIPKKENIVVGEDLSGKKISLNINTMQLGFQMTILNSENYRIIDYCDETTETVSLEKKTEGNNYSLIEKLYERNFVNHISMIEKEEITLPNDFGIVTNAIWEDNFYGYVKEYYQKIEGTTLISLEEDEIEELPYTPIILNYGRNTISTNLESANLEIVYPKNSDLVKYFLANVFTNTIQHEDNFLTLDDIYFKDSFTKIEENLINAIFNNLTIKCLNSSENKFSLDCEGNLVVNSITTNIKEEQEKALTFDEIYPIGSIYLSVNETNPNTLFGGTWTQLKDRFLLGAGSSYKNAATGGTKTHKHSTGNCTLTINQMPSHSHKTRDDAAGLYGGWGNKNHDGWGTASAQGTGGNYEVANTGGGQAHNHGNTGETNHLPPYLVVYMWKRVS